MTTPRQSLDDLLPDDLLEDGTAQPRVVHALTYTSLVGSLTGLPLILNPNDTVEVTPDLRAWNTDRTGRCSLDRTDLFAPGPAPAELTQPATSRTGSSRTFATYDSHSGFEHDLL